MALVTNQMTCGISMLGTMIKPGDTAQIDEAFARLCVERKAFRKYMEKGLSVKFEDTDTLNSYTEQAALRVIAEESNLEVLRKWARKEKREDVCAALQERLSSVGKR